MKKNLLSIVILGLLIVNVVLTSIMLFSMSGTMKKTSALIDSISVALKLEMNEGISQAEAQNVPMEDIAVHQIAEEMMIPLAVGADGKDHFCKVSVSLSMNTEVDGYKDYGETIAEKEDLLKGEIVSVISSYNVETAKADTDAMRNAILERIQQMYDSDFIFNVVFREIYFQ